MGVDVKESTQEAPGSGRARWLGPAAVGAACLLFVGQGWVSLIQKGVSGDEFVHLGAAQDYVAHGVYVMNMMHPPLVKQIAGMAMRPLRLQGRVPDVPPVGTADVGAHYWGQQ